MNKKIISALATAAFLALPVAAFASVNEQNISFDGFANATAGVGDSINAQLTYQITGGSDVESLDWELVGSGLSPTCVDIPDQINDGTFHPEFDMDTNGATAGNWDVRVRLYGDNGAGADQGCNGSVQDTMTFGNRVSITEDGNNTGVGSGTGNTSNTGNGHVSQLDKLIALLTAMIGGNTGGTPATGVCAELAQYNSLYQGSTGQQVVQLQGLLLSKGASIPALTAGASFGYFGPQTAAAESYVKSVNHCSN